MHEIRFSRALPAEAESIRREVFIKEQGFNDEFDETDKSCIHAVLFIDGNHENFDLLNAYPVEEWKGGKIHRIRPNIIHLMRGQVFVIEGNKIFTFGGASSVDREMRTEGVSWWAAEVPDYAEFDEGIANLKRHDNTVDYIITHTADERAMYYPAMVRMLARKEVRPENRMLSTFEDTVTYRHWYFGHYHIDASVNTRKTVLYHEIVPLD